MSKSRMNGMGLMCIVVEERAKPRETKELSNAATKTVAHSLKVTMIWINEGRPQKVKVLEGRGKGIGFRYVPKSC